MSIAQCTNHYNSAARQPPHAAFMRERRRAHNMVKSAAVRHAVTIGTGRVPYRVLDLACGRGGDYVKHANSNCCAAYYGIDVAHEAIMELERRARECPKVPEVHVRCGHAARDVHWESVDADICTVNFAIHYFCDTRENISALLRTASNCLRPNGILCGTYMDFTYLPDCADASVKGKWPKAHTIEKKPFGHVYHYKMGQCVDAPEYIVHFPTILKIAASHDLYLCMDRSFSGYLGDGGACQPGQRVFMLRKCPTECRTPA